MNTLENLTKGQGHFKKTEQGVFINPAICSYQELFPADEPVVVLVGHLHDGQDLLPAAVHPVVPQDAVVLVHRQAAVAVRVRLLQFPAKLHNLYLCFTIKLNLNLVFTSKASFSCSLWRRSADFFSMSTMAPDILKLLFIALAFPFKILSFNKPFFAVAVFVLVTH